MNTRTPLIFIPYHKRHFRDYPHLQKLMRGRVWNWNLYYVFCELAPTRKKVKGKCNDYIQRGHDFHFRSKRECRF